MDYENLSKEEMILLLKQLKLENEKKDQIISQKDELISEKEAIIIEKTESIAQLQAEKKDLNIKLNELIKKYEDKAEMNKKLIAEQYEPKTEKIKKIGNAINEVEFHQEKVRKQRKSPTQNFLTDLKKLADKVIYIDYDFKDSNISKEDVKEFGYDESFKIEMNPISFDVIKYIRPKYKNKEHIYQALVNDPFPHSPLTPSFAANVITMKYVLAIPLYRYSQYLKGHGLNISEYNLSNYMTRSAQLLDSLYQEMLHSLVNNSAKSIHVDETTLEVLESSKNKCYMFVYTTSFWDVPIYIYEFSEDRKTTKLQSHLADYDGFITADCFSGYDIFNNGRSKVQRCLVHCRRYFADCLKPLNKETRKNSPAMHVINLLNVLFEYEAKFREKKYTANQIKEYRNGEDYSKAIKAIDDYIFGLPETHNGLLNKAINYYKNNHDEFYTFLQDGHVDIHNNLAERAVKPFVISRKNFMFCKTFNGAEVTGKLFSIVQTAKANGLNVELYLKYALENINQKPVKEILPWSESIPNEIKIKKE